MQGTKKRIRGAISVLSLLIIFFALVTFIQSTENAYGADVELGKKVYQSRCLICHGANGNGQGA
ncbi:MAG: hypothetical protein KAI96_08260, partial [Thermodesulfovibrionia bacterium]|nr:hypothetical protein [Thermodesulfovibrionia bacterium]